MPFFCAYVLNMPRKACRIDDKPGWKWGDAGTCYPYTPGDEASEKAAIKKVIAQAIAIGEIDVSEAQLQAVDMMSELAQIVDVPVLTTGIFQGHKGPRVEVTETTLDRVIDGSNRLRNVISEALTTGEFRGNPDAAQRIAKPIPAPITLNHDVIGDDKIKDALKGVSVSFRKGLYNGKQWILETFENVPELAADIIRRFFTQASVELLNLTDPDSGEEFPTIISTAFLDRATPPAVPGQPGQLLVEFAAESEPCRILIHEPLTQGVNIMADNTQKPVDVSELRQMQDTLTAQNKALAELQAKFEAAEAEKAKAVELAMQQEAAKNAEIAELKAKASRMDAKDLMNQLKRIRKVGEQVMQISPAYEELAGKVVNNGGSIELAEGQNQQQGMYALLDEIAEMASKGAILMPLGTQGGKAYIREDDKKPDKQTRISELMQGGMSENDAWVQATEEFKEYKITSEVA